MDSNVFQIINMDVIVVVIHVIIMDNIIINTMESRFNGKQFFQLLTKNISFDDNNACKLIV